MACTVRTAHSANHHEMSALLFSREGGAFVAAARDLEGIVDRIGSGDAFAAALLQRLLAGGADQDSLEFALAAAGLKHSIAGDFSNAGVAEVEGIMASGFDVAR
jgi:2-dehydro-3-deoxygluconokinase